MKYEDKVPASVADTYYVFLTSGLESVFPLSHNTLCDLSNLEPLGDGVGCLL